MFSRAAPSIESGFAARSVIARRDHAMRCPRDATRSTSTTRVRNRADNSARSKLHAVKIDRILQRVKPKRNVHGIAAALLPFESDGRIAVDAFQQCLQMTHRTGLINAVNMDTGYVNYLSAE